MSSLVTLTTPKGREIALDDVDALADRIDALTDLLAARSEQIAELRSTLHDRAVPTAEQLDIPSVAEVKRALTPEAQQRDMYRKVAGEKYRRNGSFGEEDIDFDENAEVSEATEGDGAYVAAWVWVGKDEIE